MNLNLSESVKAYFNKEFILNAGLLLGENESSLQKAIGVLVPSIFSSVLYKADSGKVGFILGMIRDATETGILTRISRVFSNADLLSKGDAMAMRLFDGNSAELTESISRFSGISWQSANSLLSIVTPATLAVLSRKIDSLGDRERLTYLLNEDRETILDSVPAGILAALLGLKQPDDYSMEFEDGYITEYESEFADAQVRSGTGFMQNTDTNVVEKQRRSIRPALLIIVAAIALLWFTTGRKGQSDSTLPISVASAKTETHPATATEAPVAVYQALNVILPGDVKLEVKKGGIEDRLVSFLKDSSAPVDKNLWFDFDNLNFETGSATLTLASLVQVKNIAAIMKAFPNAAIKIGGYTDKKGDSTVNLKLSQERAAAV
ncbi:MAG TPA: OmpA family protein, partial [Bacteroidia bacterium]|nr:OmpA family protein [Bacteroidia bacterium]